MSKSVAFEAVNPLSSEKIEDVFIDEGLQMSCPKKNENGSVNDNASGTI